MISHNTTVAKNRDEKYPEVKSDFEVLFWINSSSWVCFRFLFSECVCNHLGSDPSTCPSPDDCYCERSSGQCGCLPNVIGQHCDQCTENTWNMASGSGCKPCDCNHVHAYGPSCNEVIRLHLHIHDLVRVLVLELATRWRLRWFSCMHINQEAVLTVLKPNDSTIKMLLNHNCF